MPSHSASSSLVNGTARLSSMPARSSFQIAQASVIDSLESEPAYLEAKSVVRTIGILAMLT